MRRAAFASCALALTLPLGSCVEHPAPSLDYHATVHRTSHGVAHVFADDLPSVYFGQGYAHWEDRGCVLADQLLKVRSRRSRYFGPGEEDVNLTSDFAYLHLDVLGRGQAMLEALPESVHAAVIAYAAGAEAARRAGRTPAECADQEWVESVDPLGMTAHFVNLGLLASAYQLIEMIGNATAPSQGAPPLPGGSLKRAGDYRRRLGSNGWAIGGERTETGRGLLLGNPHFPWEGELMLWESHLKVPGELDVYGAGLTGTPGILIGFNDAMAWTHTVSAGHRLTMYELELDPSDPTRYLHGGEYMDMEGTRYEIDVLQEDGSRSTRSRTLWNSRYGPILNVDGFGWSSFLVFTYRDANIDNQSLIEHFERMNQSRSLQDFKDAHREVTGLPWVNTISVSAEGEAWYIDSTPTPNLTQAALDHWLVAREEELLASALWDNSIVLLDGREARDDWQVVEDSRSPGLVGWSELPQLERSDYVFNANDSYWTPHHEARIEGHSPLHGPENEPRSPRTISNMDVLRPGGNGVSAFAGPDDRFTLEEMQEAFWANTSSLADRLLPEVVARCQITPNVLVNGVDVDLSQACGLLAEWDGRYTLDAKMLPWREMVGDFSLSALRDGEALWANAFDPAQASTTPNGLASPAAGETDRILEALGAGILRLQEAGIPIDATLGEAQFTKHGEGFPIHGGSELDGIPNKVQYVSFKSTLAPDMERGELVHGPTDLTDEGYVINYGTSFVFTVSYEDDGPQAEALLTYGENSDPASEFHDDQMKLFSESSFRPILFTEEAIMADEQLRSYEVSGSALN